MSVRATPPSEPRFPADKSVWGSFCFRWRRFAAVVALLATPFAPATAQQPDESREYLIKAAFLYQFSNYVTWPEASFGSPADPFVIGVYRSNPFGDALDRIAETKTVGPRPIQARTISAPDGVEECHILFLPAALSDEEIQEVLHTTAHTRVLLIGESEGFVKEGGDVQFFLDSDKVRFAINDVAIDEDDFKVSSKLLTLAKPAPDALQIAEGAP